MLYFAYLEESGKQNETVEPILWSIRYGVTFACCFRLPWSSTFVQLFPLIIQSYVQNSTLNREHKKKKNFLKEENTAGFERENITVFFFTSLMLNFKEIKCIGIKLIDNI